MRVLTTSLLYLVVVCGACSSSGAGKTPGTQPAAAATPTSPSNDPPTVTDADLACGPNVACTEIFVWRWSEESKGYCTGCTMQPLNQTGADRLSAWYKPREGRGCPMHDCERPTMEAACVEGRCVHVPIPAASVPGPG